MSSIARPRLFRFDDPDLSGFFALGRYLVNLEAREIMRGPFCAFEMSTDCEDLDFPFDAKLVTLRPGFWYALNLATCGEKKQAIAQTARDLHQEVRRQFGSYKISFLIVLPPGAEIPPHRHFRAQNSVVYCLPSSKTETGLRIEIESEQYRLDCGYLHFDSRRMHSARNDTSSTYWIFVFENVQGQENPPLVEIQEL